MDIQNPAGRPRGFKMCVSWIHMRVGAQGAKSVEVRPVGISKGLAMQRIVATMAERCGAAAVAADFVLAAGHFLARDENLFTFFEGHAVKVRTRLQNVVLSMQVCQAELCPSAAHALWPRTGKGSCTCY